MRRTRPSLLCKRAQRNQPPKYGWSRVGDEQAAAPAQGLRKARGVIDV